MNDRELRELLDARPAPGEAERATAGLPPEAQDDARAMLALARLAGALPRPDASAGFVERTMVRSAERKVKSAPAATTREARCMRFSWEMSL